MLGVSEGSELKLHLDPLRAARLQQPRHDGAEQRVAEGSCGETLRPALCVALRDAPPLGCSRRPRNWRICSTVQR